MRLKAILGVALMSYTMHGAAMLEANVIKPVLLETDADKLGYSLGARLGEHIKQFEDISFEAVFRAIGDVLNEEEMLLSADEMQHTIMTAHRQNEQRRQEQREEQALENLEQGNMFLAENSQQPGIVTLESGLQYRIVSNGKGPKPDESDTVVVHYEGRLLDGTVFDSSIERKEPASFQLNQVISGWTESLQQMPEGATWEIFVPAHLAYGSRGIPGRIGPNEMLTFKVELIEVKNS